MVLQPDDKRRVLSHSIGKPLNQVPVTELGVSMGLQLGTDRTQWLLSNGVVVPRLPIAPLLPPHLLQLTRTYYYLLLTTTTYYNLHIPTTTFYLLLLPTTTYYLLLPTTTYKYLLLPSTNYYYYYYLLLL